MARFSARQPGRQARPGSGTERVEEGIGTESKLSRQAAPRNAAKMPLRGAARHANRAGTRQIASEARPGKGEVVGSIPTGSTRFFKHLQERPDLRKSNSTDSPPLFARCGRIRSVKGRSAEPEPSTLQKRLTGVSIVEGVPDAFPAIHPRMCLCRRWRRHRGLHGEPVPKRGARSVPLRHAQGDPQSSLNRDQALDRSI
jgi:hypothetical protein